MAGRRPKPTALKVLQGTDQPCRINKNEMKPDVCLPDPPEEATDKVKKYWPKIAKPLYDCGVLTALDVNSLSAYCELYLRWTEANKEVARYGIVVKSPGGFPVQSPYVSISNKAFELMQKMAVEFGMTPSSRTRISADPEMEKNKNRFANL